MLNTLELELKLVSYEVYFHYKYKTQRNITGMTQQYSILIVGHQLKNCFQKKQLVVEKEQGVGSMRQNTTSLVHNEQKPKQEKG